MKRFIFVLLLCLPSLLGVVQAADSQPNILHIHTDDHRPDGLQSLGNRQLVTPNLDEIARRGMVFTNCYTMGSMVGAVCEPSRAMLLTGRSWLRIPGGSDAATNASDPATFLPRVLGAAGYQTFHMGKTGNGFQKGTREFEINVVDDARGKTPKDDRAHCPERLATRTIEFLETREGRNETRPFYAYLAPPVPHDPRTAEPEFHELYHSDEIKLSPAFLPLHPFNNGEMTVRDERLAPWPRTPEDTKRQNAEYYACITGLDHHVGRIFDKLKASGEWENTIVIFSGDNGLSLGDHGLFGKQNLYEFGGMHVPLVVAGPGISPGINDSLLYLMDLFPTFVELAGAALPSGVEGKSIVPILHGEQTQVRDTLYTAYRKCQRSVRDDRWKLIRYPLIDRTQLFDLSKDPLELNDLAGEPEYATKMAEMTAKLEAEMEYFGDTAPLTVDNPKPAEWSPPAAKKPAPKAAK
ncbi:sulfatase-like hydrolase/transferase [Aporhodopirellula aestuarii]|uniref:Sulfatase-like hydrolase/transferase n=1 Tax=Aporhodopirellula aestuarii TaxID=2950107 RepID=A0ABT0UD66_9BACT|nr:sulfatase-like hydrolase/transferase [Aporhodopirellula aestuarii]MCM2374983.1 sulfatase-like hydrolase/transferase [Aporhodopirellula aestuarii]